MNSTGRAFRRFGHIDDSIIHFIDGHVHSGSSVLIVQCNEFGYGLTGIRKLHSMQLFTKIKDLVFESRSGRLEGCLS